MDSSQTGPVPSVRAEGARVDRLRVVLGLAMLVMLALSWPLWIETAAFPRVPFVAGLPSAGGPASWLLPGAVAAAVAMAAGGIAWRAALGVSLVGLVSLVAQDQHRLQPWVDQFLILGLVLATLPGRQALTLARWWFVALYVESGLSKLDVSFCHELGPVFLAAALRPFGVSPAGWPEGARDALILGMPGFEILVALALAVPATRPIGRVGAVVLHATLLAILGPWGLGHSTIVLVWNAATMIEVWIAFGPVLATDDVPAGPGPQPRPVPDAPTTLGRLTWTVFGIAMVLPLGERWGLFDSWPSHALYASHVERTHIYLHEEDLAGVPAEVRRHLVAREPGPWLVLDQTAWSRSVRGVPLYPQGRAGNGLAEALAARPGGPRLIRVVQWGRAGCWTGRRTRVECVGLDAICRQAGRYWLNAHPEGTFSDGDLPSHKPGA